MNYEMANKVSNVLNALSNHKLIVGCGVIVSGAVLWAGFRFLRKEAYVKKVR